MYEYTENIGKKFFDFVKRGFKLHMLISFTFVTLFVLSSIAFGSLIYNFWTNYNYKLEFILLIFIILDASFNILQSSLNTILKSVNKFFKPISIEVIISLIAFVTTCLILSAGYDFKYALIINSISSLISLTIFVYFSLKFYKNLKK